MNVLATARPQNQILWARIAYWTGALADLIVGIVVF
jgi:hypothetical protein